MKCLILRRRTLTVLACALLAAAMFALVNAPAVGGGAHRPGWGGGLRHRPAASHLLRSAGPEDAGHLL